MTIAPALKRIADELRKLAKDAETDPVDSFHLSTLARKVDEQRHMIEEGLVG